MSQLHDLITSCWLVKLFFLHCKLAGQNVPQRFLNLLGTSLLSLEYSGRCPVGKVVNVMVVKCISLIIMIMIIIITKYRIVAQGLAKKIKLFLRYFRIVNTPIYACYRNSPNRHCWIISVIVLQVATSTLTSVNCTSFFHKSRPPWYPLEALGTSSWCRPGEANFREELMAMQIYGLSF